MSRILNNLFLGSYGDAKNQSLLMNSGITHIVTVGAELKTAYPRSFKYLYIPAYDSPDYKLIVYFDEIADFIHNACTKENGKVLVHCHWGISRSTTSVLAYLIKYHGMSPAQARSFVKQRRNQIYPNDGFMQQLETYAKKITKKKEEKYNQDVQEKLEKEARRTAGGTRFWPNNEELNREGLGSKASMRASSIVNFGQTQNKPSSLKQTSIFANKTSTGFAKGLFEKRQDDGGIFESRGGRRPVVSFSPEPVRKSQNERESREMIIRKTTIGFGGYNKSLAPAKEETKVAEVKTSNGDFCCLDCGYKLFSPSDVMHSPKTAQCNAIYLQFMSWIGFTRGNVSKIFCPNSRCNVVLGFTNQKGGKCNCGHMLDRMFVIYPSRVTNSFKAKNQTNRLF